MAQFRLTKQRQIILDALNKRDFHPTPEELYSLIKGQLPGMGLCTIYRNLEKFHELGLIEKITGKPVRYEGNPNPHNHIKCIRCGKVEDLMLDVQFDTQAVERMGYKLHAFNLEINGICSQCQKSPQEEAHVETQRHKN